MPGKLYVIDRVDFSNSKVIEYVVGYEDLSYESEQELFDVPGPTPLSWGLTWDGSHFWVSDWNDWRLDKVAFDGTLVESYPHDGDELSHDWHTIRDITFDGTHIWAITFGSSTIGFKQIDPANGMLTGVSIEVIDQDAHDPMGLASDRSGSFYLAYKDDNNFNEPYIAKYSGGSWGTPVHNIDFGTGSSLFEVHGLHYVGGFLLASDLADDRVYRLDFESETGDEWFNTIAGGGDPRGLVWIEEAVGVIPPLRLIQRDDGLHAT